MPCGTQLCQWSLHDKPLFVSKSTVDFFVGNDYCLRVLASKPQTARPDPDLKQITSELLLGEKKELLIVHNGREYRLRLTQYGKLILTA